MLLAVKPQIWREAAQAVAPCLSPEALIVSVAAGVRAGGEYRACALAHRDGGDRHHPRCGPAPAYLYAFTEALEAAGEAEGLPADVAQALARATMAGAAALMAASGEDPAELRRQVTSPNGTTEAALKVLMGEGGLGPLMRKAVAAAADRSRELSKS